MDKRDAVAEGERAEFELERLLEFERLIADVAVLFARVLFSHSTSMLWKRLHFIALEDCSTNADVLHLMTGTRLAYRAGRPA